MDPILLSVLTSRYSRICEEMGIVILRTAHSPILNEARDFTASMFDAEGRLISQADFIPIQVAASPFAVNAVIEHFGNSMKPGDVVILNDPYNGGNHLADLTLVYPMFHNGRLVFWLVNRAHYGDVGGSVPGAYNPGARELCQEGVIIPPIKLYEGGVLNESVRKLLLSNVRQPITMWGDLQTQIAAAKVGERRLGELIGKYGISALLESVDLLIESSESRMRGEIQRIPDGTYTATTYIEGSGLVEEDIAVKVEVRIKGTDICFDYSGSGPQVQAYINSPLSNTFSATYIALFTVINPDTPRNYGSYRVISIEVPKGTILNPNPPAPVGLCTLTTAEAVIEACWLALSKAVPDLVSAGWARTYNPLTSGYRPGASERYSMIHFFALGGGGASCGHDGWHHLSPVICSGSLTKPSVEMTEVQYPISVLQYELNPDSGGAGKYRGGLGTVYRCTPVGHESDFVIYGNGVKIPAFGIAGGLPGETHHASVEKKDGSRIPLFSNAVMRLSEGEVFDIRSGGGGGWGDPLSRNPETVRTDVLNGYVSPEQALERYGVVLDEGSGELDMERTSLIRSQKAKEICREVN